MNAPLDVWDQRLRSLFGLSLLQNPARLRDGLHAACKELDLADDGALLARVDVGDKTAKRAIARALTVGETYFFREPKHFELLRDVLLPAALARQSSPVVLVSAGCSSGEEAYSLAMTARHVLGSAATGKVEVLGFDVNERSLSVARRGVYRAWSLRGVAEDVRRRSFVPSESTWSVVAEARSLTRFERRNLVDEAEALPPSSADVIFFRNVLIYLDDVAVKLVLRRLSEALRPGGALVVSSAEVAFFAIAELGAHQASEIWVHTPGDALSAGGYGESERAASSAQRGGLPGPMNGPLSSGRGVERSTHTLGSPRAASSRTTGTPKATTDAVPEAVHAAVSNAPVTMASDAAASNAPVPIAEDAAASNAPVPIADDAATQCLEHGWSVLGTDPASACAEARRAILLDRTLVSAHVLAASAAFAQSNATSARRSLRHARRYLAKIPSAAVLLGGGGTTAAEMDAYCARLERSLSGPAK